MQQKMAYSQVDTYGTAYLQSLSNMNGDLMIAERLHKGTLCGIIIHLTLRPTELIDDDFPAFSHQIHIVCVIICFQMCPITKSLS
jgi:hypothetical protein